MKNLNNPKGKNKDLHIQRTSHPVETIGHGAEAKVFVTTFLERDAVVKVRPEKGYRHPELDRRLRTSRTKNEARVIREARHAGVRTPVIYDIDLKECSITMERISGMSVKSILDKDPENADTVCEDIGRMIAKLHTAGISHGDLTTSNMIRLDSGELCLIDLSMGNSSAELEDLGVDIHLLKRAFMSAHSGIESSFERLLSSYRKEMKNADRVFAKVEEIKNRGRYT